MAALADRPGATIRLDALRRPWLLQALDAIGAVSLALFVVRANATRAFLYRGGFMLVGVAGAAFVAAASVSGPISRVLSLRPLRLLGLISYGVYLWHWPVDVVLDQTRSGLSGFPLLAARGAVTLAISIASYVLIERPIRRHGLAALRVRWTPLRPLATATVAALVAALLVLSTGNAVSEPSVKAFVKAQRRTAKPNPASARILMLGDSQMFTLGLYGADAFSATGPQYHFDPILGCGVFGPGMQPGGACDSRAVNWQRDIRNFNPDVSVLLIGAWESLDFIAGGHIYIHGTEAHERELVKIVSASIKPLLARHGAVALLEVPCFGDPEPEITGAVGAERSAPGATGNVNDALATVAAAEPGQVTYIRWAGAICPSDRFTPDRRHQRQTRRRALREHEGRGRSSSPTIAPQLRRLALEVHEQRLAAK